jgi:iron complex outermembrane receptor protein
VTPEFKVRLSARQNWFTTAGEARTASPVNPGNVYPCATVPTGCPFVPGQAVSRTDTPFSWEIGAVYFVQPHTSLFAGYADASYPIFNTEEPQTIAQAPERSEQYEVGVRYELPAKIAVSSSLFQASRQNVFDLLTIPNPSGPGNFDVASFFDYRVSGWENDINLNFGNWNFIGNLTIQRPTITNYPVAADEGHSVPSVPSVLANFWTTYDFVLPEPLPHLRAAAGLQYQGKEFSDVGQTRIIPGAPVVDFALQMHGERYSVVVGINISGISCMARARAAAHIPAKGAPSSCG